MANRPSSSGVSGRMRSGPSATAEPMALPTGWYFMAPGGGGGNGGWALNGGRGACPASGGAPGVGRPPSPSQLPAAPRGAWDAPLSLAVPGGQRWGPKNAVLHDIAGCTGCALCATVCPDGCITVYRDVVPTGAAPKAADRAKATNGRAAPAPAGAGRLSAPLAQEAVS